MASVNASKSTTQSKENVYSAGLMPTLTVLNAFVYAISLEMALIVNPTATATQHRGYNLEWFQALYSKLIPDALLSKLKQHNYQVYQILLLSSEL